MIWVHTQVSSSSDSGGGYAGTTSAGSGGGEWAARWWLEWFAAPPPAASCACGWPAGIAWRAEGLGGGTVTDGRSEARNADHLRAAAGGPLSIGDCGGGPAQGIYAEHGTGHRWVRALLVASSSRLLAYYYYLVVRSMGFVRIGP